MNTLTTGNVFFLSRRSKNFRIKSELNGKVLDIEGANRSPGATVLMWGQKPGVEDNQLWYEDQYGIIKSKLNDFCIDASGKTIYCHKYPNQIPHQYKGWGRGGGEHREQTWEGRFKLVKC